MKLQESNIISVNSKVVRSVNRAMILNLIREHQPISRVNIARMTGLNKSTVSSIVTDLLNEDLIFEKEVEDQNIGRNPIHLYLKLGKCFVGAINIDSTATRFAISDIDGSIIAKSSMTTSSGTPEEFISLCIDKVNELARKNNISMLKGLGVSSTGIVDSNNLKINFAPNLGWENVDIGAVIKSKCPEIPNIAVDNDAQASALAELWFGKHEIDLSNCVFLSIGPGIGSGIVVENKLLDGVSHASGEFGHMTLFHEGEQCTCGNLGCWEAYASERAAVKRYVKRAVREYDEKIDVIFQDIIDLARDGDEISMEIISENGKYLGYGISNIIKALDPHAIILSGKITQLWDVIYPEIIKVVESRAFVGNKQINILPTSLEISPRLLGAATLAIKTIFDDYKIMV